MKKIISMLMICVICLNFIGCDVINKHPSDIEFEPGVFNMYDLSIYDSKSEKQIYIGMDKKDVDKILGDSIQDDSYNPECSYDGFKIKFKDDKIISMNLSTLYLEKYDRYITNRGIFLGMRKQDVLEVYGVDWRSDMGGTYVLLKKDNRLILLTDVQDSKKYNTDDMFFISFMFSNNGGIVDYISIRDYNH